MVEAVWRKVLAEQKHYDEHGRGSDPVREGYPIGAKVCDAVRSVECDKGLVY